MKTTDVKLKVCPKCLNIDIDRGERWYFCPRDGSRLIPVTIILEIEAKVERVLLKDSGM